MDRDKGVQLKAILWPSCFSGVRVLQLFRPSAQLDGVAPPLPDPRSRLLRYDIPEAFYRISVPTEGVCTRSMCLLPGDSCFRNGFRIQFIPRD
jgi:hypothetical protein